MADTVAVEGLEEEFQGVSLGDARLEKRLAAIAARLGAVPDDSFPDQMRSVAEREALYRFLSNSKVTLDAVLEPHRRQTLERVAKQRAVRIVHDTTVFQFNGDREGLGIFRRGSKGFFGHVALAIGDGDMREPLGVLGVRTHIHEDAIANRRKTRSQRSKETAAKERSHKETSRWEGLAIDVAEQLPAGVDAIHVMDQEADSYDIMSALLERRVAFVIRGDAARRTASDRIPAREVLASMPSQIFRTVTLTARGAKRTTKKPARSERTATLSLRWGTITLRRGQQAQSTTPEISLTAVHVLEHNPPAGEAAVEWMLFTSESVASLDDAAAIVDHYRARWIIEEYFKALKTGCSFEKRQLESLDALVRALALFVPLAWRLLVLRHLGRQDAPPPANAIFDAEQLLLLRTLLDHRDRSYKFPRDPTVRDAMLAIAHLGGHIKNNGDPGWMVLGRGFTRFAEAEAVWRLARGCDQSSVTVKSDA